jgi:signal transduction histidine kinase
MDSSLWSTQQLAEFIAGVSVAETESAAARAAVERAAEALDADVAAIMRCGEVVAAVGYPENSAPAGELAQVRPGAAPSWLDVPGAGRCAATAAALGYPPDATLVLARPCALTSQETGLLRGMAQVTAMTMRMLSVLGAERAVREEIERLAGEQAALRRVAALVAKAAAPEEIFAAVAEELARLSGADIAMVLRYETAGAATVLGCWSGSGVPAFIGRRLTVAGEGVAVPVQGTGQPARAVRLAGPPGSVADSLRRAGMLAGSGSLIVVDGRLWGVAITATARPGPLCPEVEHRLAAFAELVATAIAKAQARVELRAIAAEQAALRRVATLVARGAAPGAVFAAVAEEVGQVLPEADHTMVCRYDAGRDVEVAGGWSRSGSQTLVGRRLELGGRNVSTLVFKTGQPARVDDLTDGGDAVTVIACETGMRSAVGAPISVEGRLWGVMIVASTRVNALPAGTEHRLAAFTDLIATTIADTQARVELSTIAEEQAALRRVATLVARGEPPRAIFEAVAQEVGRLLPADLTVIGRWEDGLVTGVAGWSSAGEHVPLSERVSLGGRNVIGTVFSTGRSARMDCYGDASGTVAADARARGVSSSVGAPISVEGRMWGVMVAAATRGRQLPPDTEERLAGFTELVATALANAEAREELRRVADEQAALRRVATLVARGASSSTLFRAVAEEVSLLLPADATVLGRYDPDGHLTRVGRWSRPGVRLPSGERAPLGGRNVNTLVFKTGQAARLDSYDDAAGEAAAWVAAGLRSSVGVPISVKGRLWGVVVAASMSAEPLPADAAARLAGFTELVATAIANAQAQAELTASRARIVATADETRRRIERDLHDGAQQQLVSLGLRLRAAQAAVPAELGNLHAELGQVAAGLSTTLDGLREYARGIHPAILAEGGLAPALKTLARRSSIPVTLDAQIHERLSERAEVAAYYVVSEALANAAKHAHASVIVVNLDVDAAAKVLRLLIRDDGVGGADPSRGSGLVGLKDRVEAIGGTLSVRSHPGEGTALFVELPVGHLSGLW